MVREHQIGRWHYDPKLPHGQRHHFDDDLQDDLHIPDDPKSLKDVILACWPIITDFTAELDRERTLRALEDVELPGDWD